jgi:DNA-binding transcriptional LysR family regulator
MIQLGLALGSGFASTPLVLMGAAGVFINVILMALNLIPLPPLDGGRIAVSLLPAVISSFHRLRPDVRLVISDADSQAVRRRVRYDEADIGIVSASPQHCVSEDVILQDSLGIVYRPGGSIAEALEKPGTRPSWELLLLEPLIVNPLCHMVDNPRVHVHLAQCTLEARNTTALLSCVQRGLGATVLPPNAVTPGMADVAFIQPDDPPVYRVLQRIRSEERHLSPVGEAFWQALSPQQAALSTMRQ